MYRFAFLVGICVTVGVSCASPRPAATATQNPPRKPNVLVILTDDQGWATLGSYGATRIATPNLDRLASHGMRFTNAYVHPQCTPTRASLLTGQHTARNRLWHVLPWYGYSSAPVAEPPFAENLPRSAFNLAKGLKASGYTTALVGKWHLTANDDDGYYDGLYSKSAAAFGFDYVGERWVNKAEQSPGGDKAVLRMTDETIAFIEKNRDKPFFCMLAHHTVHNLVVAPLPIVEKYRALGAPEKGPFNATYLAALEHLDASVGRVMDALERTGVASNTLVTFLSDNGGVSDMYDADNVTRDRPLTVKEQQFPNAPLRAGKGTLYEGGIRVPFIVRWPGRVAAGTTSAVPIQVVDLLPTIFEATRASTPPDYPVDGVSLVSLLEQRAIPQERPLFWYAPLYDMLWGATPAAAVRQGRYKLIHHFGDRFGPDGKYLPGEAFELFDLDTDLGETTDLSTALPEITTALRAQLATWIADMGAPVPGANPNHDSSREFQKSRRGSGVH
jgi:arylsulfatase A